IKTVASRINTPAITLGHLSGVFDKQLRILTWFMLHARVLLYVPIPKNSAQVAMNDLERVLLGVQRSQLFL
ncbi:Hypothetical protein FKW44_020894, partial [Caligus rogercresseyi]